MKSLSDRAYPVVSFTPHPDRSAFAELIQMIAKPKLTPGFCLHVARNAAPYPSRFDPAKDDPTQVKIFDLGVVGSMSTAFYIEAVKSRLGGWHIDDSSVAGTPDTTLQAAADSIQTGAF